MRPQRAAGKGRSFHDDLHAFSTGGILFGNNGALRKERVSDGILFANSSKKYAKNAARNRWFLLAFFGDFLSLLKESYPSETKGEKTAGKGHHRGAKHKIPQKRIDISLIPAII